MYFDITQKIFLQHFSNHKRDLNTIVSTTAVYVSTESHQQLPAKMTNETESHFEKVRILFDFR